MTHTFFSRFAWYELFEANTPSTCSATRGSFWGSRPGGGEENQNPSEPQRNPADQTRGRSKEKFSLQEFSTDRGWIQKQDLHPGEAPRGSRYQINVFPACPTTWWTPQQELQQQTENSGAQWQTGNSINTRIHFPPDYLILLWTKNPDSLLNYIKDGVIERAERHRSVLQSI